MNKTIERMLYEACWYVGYHVRTARETRGVHGPLDALTIYRRAKMEMVRKIIKAALKSDPSLKPAIRKMVNSQLNLRYIITARSVMRGGETVYYKRESAPYSMIPNAFSIATRFKYKDDAKLAMAILKTEYLGLGDWNITPAQ